MAWTFLRPKRPDWLLGAGVTALVSLLGYALASWLRPWHPGRFWGLAYGTLAAVLFVLLALYPLRRRLLSWPLGNARRWVQFHVYGGAIACLLVLEHAGFRWPSGTMGQALLLLTLWVTASGLVGVFLQKWIPTVLTESLSVEVLYERVPELVARLEEEADELLEDCSEGLEQVYLERIRPMIAAPEPSWSYVLDARGRARRMLQPLDEVRPFVPEEDRERLADLRVICQEKFELDAHYSLQRCLRTWVALHSPPSLLLIGLVGVHVIAVLLH